MWQFEKADNGEYYLKNVGPGLYVGAVPTADNVKFDLVEKANAATYVVAAAATNGHVNIYSSTGEANLETLHMVNWDGVVRWSKAADASTFLLMDADEVEATFAKYYTLKNGHGGYVSADYSDNNGRLTTRQVPLT